MQRLDNEFFEEYKSLDKLCSEIYDCQNGMSEYITQMESKAYAGENRVKSWNSDYKMLKQVRKVRNIIAHDAGNYQISEETDLKFVRDFRGRILKGQDPMALLRKSYEEEAKRAARLRKQKTDQPRPTIVTPKNNYTKNKNNKATKIIVGLIAAILIAVIVLLLNI